MFVKNLPRIGITMGDAAGIGPEIIVKALARRSTYAVCQPIVIGSHEVLHRALQFVPTAAPRIEVQTIETPMQAKAQHGTIDVLDVAPLSPADISHGRIDARCGYAAVEALEAATHLACQGHLDGITTAPICKAALHRAGIPYTGHTEMLADFTNTPQVVMMLCTPNALRVPLAFETDVAQRGSGPFNLRVFSAPEGEKYPKLAVSFVTTHIPLASVPTQLTKKRLWMS